MRARAPDLAGVAERAGAKVAFEVCGEGDPAVFLIPPCAITHSRSWKGQIPFLARRGRMVTTDGRGTGRSDRCALAAPTASSGSATHLPHARDPVKVNLEIEAFLRRVAVPV